MKSSMPLFSGFCNIQLLEKNNYWCVQILRFGVSQQVASVMNCSYIYCQMAYVSEWPM